MSNERETKKPAAVTGTRTTHAFIGTGYHIRYSMYHVVDEAGNDVAKGRTEHAMPREFGNLVKRFPAFRVVLDAFMNWH